MAGVDGKAGNFSRLRGFPPLLQNLDSDTNFRHSDDVTITSKYCMSEWLTYVRGITQMSYPHAIMQWYCISNNCLWKVVSLCVTGPPRTLSLVGSCALPGDYVCINKDDGKLTNCEHRHLTKEVKDVKACESSQVSKFDDISLNCQTALQVSLSRIAIALPNGSVQYTDKDHEIVKKRKGHKIYHLRLPNSASH